MGQDFGRLQVKAGRIDLNTEFSVNQTGAIFVNGAQGVGHDLGQVASYGASLFPATNLGGVAQAALPHGWSLRGGAFEERAPRRADKERRWGVFQIGEVSGTADWTASSASAWPMGRTSAWSVT